MIKKHDQVRMIERYEFFISTQSGKTYEFRWKSWIKTYYTCGMNSFEIECMEVIPETIEIFPMDEDLPNSMDLSGFNKINPDDQLDFRCNCHGFSFANGKFSINESFVSDILVDEYHPATSSEISNGNFDIVLFMGMDDRCVHSCKYQYDLYIHKEGLRKFSVHTSIEEINDIEEYKNTVPVYYKRNSRSCPGICLNSIGEKHFKTFGNN